MSTESCTQFPRLTPDLSVAVIGLACRFPDADNPPALLDTILTGRRAFRQLPPRWLGLAAGDAAAATDPAVSPAGLTRAALIEGWCFDTEAFRIPAPAYLGADPAHWLALETAARALEGAGFAGGEGLDRERIGVIMATGLAADVSRASALRLRWPYVRRVLAESLLAGGVRSDRAGKVLRHAAARYLAPVPLAGEHGLTPGQPGTIPARISSYFGFGGGGHDADAACSSSLQAIASACAALVAGDLDVVLAGGVDAGLDPLELAGLASAGMLASGEMRVYDERPTGYLPGEGCGVVVLMRTAQARAAGLPVYAEIAGWGTSSSAPPGLPAAEVSSQLLALHRAHEQAGIDPGEVQLIEGHGSGTASGDETELTALAELRSGARQAAALGSVKANIGHAKAAGGAAGLIKTVLALSTGVIPPATGVGRPHRLLTDRAAALRLPEVAEEWPPGHRLAGVSEMGAGGTNVHLVLRTAPEHGARDNRLLRVLPRLARAGSGQEHAAGQELAAATSVRELGRPATPFLLHAPGRAELAAALTRVAGVARWLSDAELTDLACQFGRDARTQGPVRAAIVASSQEELARRAGEAAALLPGLREGLMSVRPGLFVADHPDGRITLLLSDAVTDRTRDEQPADGPASPDDAPEAVTRSLATLRWIEALDVNATAAVGHGTGELAGLAWAGVLSESDVREIAALRAEFLSGPVVQVAAGAGRHAGGHPAELAPVSDASSLLRAAMGQFQFGPPRRRLISTVTGQVLASAAEVIDLICGGCAEQDQLDAAVAAGAHGATLLVETGPGRLLASSAARVGQVPVVGAGTGPDCGPAWAGAALFAAGAAGQVQSLFPRQSARPIDIWRDQVFITSPSLAAPGQPTRAAASPAGPGRGGAELQQPARGGPASTAGITVQSVTLSPAGRAGQAAAAAPADAARPAGVSLPDPASPADSPSPADSASPADSPSPADSASPADSPSPAASASPAASPSPAIEPGDPDAGVASWVRCFTRELGPAAPPPDPGDDRPWVIRAAGSYPFRHKIGSCFQDDPGAGRNLAVIGDPAAPGALQEALFAARDARGSGLLVAITTAPGLTGFLASLHAEQPSLGITVLQVPSGPDGLALARPHARVALGKFRELVIGADGLGREPAARPWNVRGGGAFPLGPTDVALVSRQSGAAALALAQVLACSGTAVAVVGRTQPGEEDGQVVAGLEELRVAGARVAYEVVNVADPGDMSLAVQRIERRLGPVTAVAHAVGPSATAPFTELDAYVLDAALRTEQDALQELLRPLQMSRLRLILTFGSVAGQYGLAGQGLLAAASTALAGRARAVAAGIAGCRALQVDLPGWSGAGLGERPGLGQGMAAAGLAPVDVGDISRLLLKLLAVADLPEQVAMHGRAGLPGTGAAGAGLAGRELAGPDRAGAGLAGTGLTGTGLAPAQDLRLPGRFLRDIVVHYPGVELISDVRLSPVTDPYLADYQVGDSMVLPPAMALEALAQAASALAGRPLRNAVKVAVNAPVVIPAGPGAASARIRICALADGGTVTAVLRCADSGFNTDHVRAEFRCAEAGTREPVAVGEPGSGSAGSGGTAAAGRAAAATEAAGFGTTAGLGETPGLMVTPGSMVTPGLGVTAGLGVAGILPEAAGGIVDGAELYGPVCFQSGRFRRIAMLPEITSRSCRALARGSEAGGSEFGGSEFGSSAEGAWFAEPGGRHTPGAGADNGLLLGSPGLNDVPLQILQACVPHRRIWLAGCDAVTFSGTLAQGPVEIRAVAVPLPRSAAGSRTVPAPAQSSETLSPETSSPETMRAGTRRADQPALPPAAGLAWDIDVMDATGQPLASWRGVRLRAGDPLPRTASWPPALLSLYLEQGAIALGLDPGLRVSVRCESPVPGPRAAGARAGTELDPEAAGLGPLSGFTLDVRGTSSAAGGWVLAEPQPPVWRAGENHLAETFARLRDHLPEPPGACAARLRAAADCLALAGGPPGALMRLERATPDGWALLEVAGTHVACTVAAISGLPRPVAIAIVTGEPRHASPPGPGQPGEAQPAARAGHQSDVRP